MCSQAECWRWTRRRSRPGARGRARYAPGGYGRCTGTATRSCSPTRRHVHAFLGEFRGTLLTDGYEAYAAYAGRRSGEVTHASCWSHTRRGFERANDSEPEAVAGALALIGALYGHEKQIRADGLVGDDKHAYRQTHSRPVVETFWRWCDAQCHRTELLPKSPLAKALNYALARRSGLEVFLDKWRALHLSSNGKRTVMESWSAPAPQTRRTRPESLTISIRHGRPSVSRATGPAPP